MAPAIVLLHGFTHTGTSWDPVRRALPRGYRSLAPDLPGHGTRGALRQATLAAILAELDSLPFDHFTLGGYSMGGRIALHAALSERLRGRIEQLVLIGASPGLADRAERAQRRRSDEGLAAELGRLPIGEFADRWAATPVLAGQPAKVRARARRERLKNDPAGLAAALRSLGTGALPSLWGRLAELVAPVVLVAGERDVKFTALARQMASEIPHAQVEIIPGAGHAVHLEAPTRVAALLAQRGPGR